MIADRFEVHCSRDVFVSNELTGPALTQPSAAADGHGVQLFFDR
jgi:hypothetical protein